MEFICRTTGSAYEFLDIGMDYKNIFHVTYKAKLNNVVIVDASSKESLNATGLFLKIEETKKFQLATVDTNFAIVVDVDNKYLKSTQSYGWQVSVGIVDSGIKKGDCTKLVKTVDFTDYKNSLASEHGTIVGKIIENYAPGALLTSLKVAHSGEDITSGRIIQSIDAAIDLELDILNISLEMAMDDEFGNECLGNCIICEYINEAVDAADMIIVCSAGNQGKEEGNTIGCPGRAEKAITVGATDEEKKLSLTSSKGDPTFMKPNILAPGFVKLICGTNIRMVKGTSFSAPIVTGILAAVYNTLGKDAAINCMYQTCEDLGYYKFEQGFGLINLEKFMEVAFNDGIYDSSARQRES